MQSFKTLIVLVLISYCCGLTYCHVHSSPFDEINHGMKHLVRRPESSIQISVTPTVLEKSGDWVIVKFGGVTNPRKGDWIGVYSPADADVAVTSPVKWQFAKMSPTYLHDGYGSLNFSLVNMHADVAFAFFRNGTDYPVFVAKSNVVTFKNPNEPLQGHIALTANENEIRVMWATGYTSGDQFVKYGTQTNKYSYYAIAETDTYAKEDLCGAPANGFGWKNPGLLQNAVLSNLVPGTTYYYRYGNDNLTGWSEEFSFKAPLAPSPDQEVSIFAFGDMGKGEIDGAREHWEEKPSIYTTEHMIRLRKELDLVLHIGDISYAVGYSAQWDRFMEQIQPIASHVPYMTCPGNHERDFPNSNSYFNGTDSGGECGIPYEKRFIMPLPGPDKPWYSFNMGPIHFMLMSTEHDFTKQSEQYDWIKSDLEGVDRKKTPWIVFSGHRPMYVDSNFTAGNNGDQPVANLLRDSLEDLFVRYGVDLALWGHHHSYQRSCPVYRSKCQSNPRYPVHAVIGMAGMGLTQNFTPDKPEWVVYADDKEYGYTRIWANSTSLRMKFYGNESGLKDEFELSK